MNIYYYTARPYIFETVTSIRNKVDIINLILCFSKFLYANALNFEHKYIKRNEFINVTICIDKMKRIFIEQKDSIHSFQYPFSIMHEDGFHKLSFMNNIVDIGVIMHLIQIFDSFSDTSPISSIYDRIFEIMLIPDESDETDLKLLEEITNFLMTFEAGYVRYDYDPTRACPMKHPEHHIDFNYHTNTTHKLGLTKAIKFESFMEILNVKCDCRYLLDK